MDIMLQPRCAMLCALLAFGCNHPSNAIPSAGVAKPANTTAEASSMQRELQSIAQEELNALAIERQPEAATILMLRPETGEIVANAGIQRGTPSDVALNSAFITGSTLKTLTLAAALETGVIQETDSFDCENGRRTYPGGKNLQDSSEHGILPVPQMLAVSTNVGFSKIFDRLGGVRLIDWLRRFQLGVPPAVAGSTSGMLPDSVEDGSLRGSMLAGGELATATPLQMAAAYGVFANRGYYVPPTVSRRTAAASPRERVLSERTNGAVMRMLAGTVYSENGTGRAARIQGVKVAGKTGTADLGERRAVGGLMLVSSALSRRTRRALSSWSAP
jgi:cell division protein FtsI (penicillin-binding protein 3)